MDKIKAKITWQRIGNDNVVFLDDEYFVEVDFMLSEDDNKKTQIKYMDHLVKCWNSYAEELKNGKTTNS